MEVWLPGSSFFWIRAGILLPRLSVGLSRKFPSGSHFPELVFLAQNRELWLISLNLILKPWNSIDNVFAIHYCVTNYPQTWWLKNNDHLLSLTASKCQEFRNSFWFRVSLEPASSEGLTGARGSTSTVTHSHNWQDGAGYWPEASVPFCVGFPTGLVESPHTMMAVLLIPRCSDEVVGDKTTLSSSTWNCSLVSQQYLSSKVVSEYRRLILIFLLLFVLFSKVE